eukprot:gene12707-14611_t
MFDGMCVGVHPTATGPAPYKRLGLPTRPAAVQHDGLALSTLEWNRCIDVDVRCNAGSVEE